MVRPRLLTFLALAATAALLVFASLSTGTVHRICLFAFFLMLGMSIGILIARTLFTSRRFVDSTNSIRPRPLTGELLNSTINEMREGLIVIDADMWIVASNRAARRLFSNGESPIESRRITE